MVVNYQHPCRDWTPIDWMNYDLIDITANANKTTTDDFQVKPLWIGSDTA